MPRHHYISNKQIGAIWESVVAAVLAGLILEYVRRKWEQQEKASNQ